MRLEVLEDFLPRQSEGDLWRGLLTSGLLKNQLTLKLPALPMLGCVQFALCVFPAHEWFSLQHNADGQLQF